MSAVRVSQASHVAAGVWAVSTSVGLRFQVNRVKAVLMTPCCGQDATRPISAAEQSPFFCCACGKPMQLTRQPASLVFAEVTEAALATLEDQLEVAGLAPLERAVEVSQLVCALEEFSLNPRPMGVGHE